MERAMDHYCQCCGINEEEGELQRCESQWSCDSERLCGACLSKKKVCYKCKKPGQEELLRLKKCCLIAIVSALSRELEATYDSLNVRNRIISRYSKFNKEL